VTQSLALHPYTAQTRNDLMRALALSIAAHDVSPALLDCLVERGTYGIQYGPRHCLSRSLGDLLVIASSAMDALFWAFIHQMPKPILSSVGMRGLPL
jgi:hypothetical protein